VIISDVGYQFFATEDLVVVEVDFYGCQWYVRYGLGLSCDVVVEFGLGEGLVVGGSRGEFLNLASLIISDGCANVFDERTNPDILTAFVAYFDCAGDFAVDLLETGNRFQLQLLMFLDWAIALNRPEKLGGGQLHRWPKKLEYLVTIGIHP
jgi:hypothetical protein